MSDLTEIILRVIIAVATIVALTRIHGLRSFSKMSGFDFAITVATGSVLAGAVTTLSTPLWHFIAALAALFALQIVMAQLRSRNNAVESAMDNTPMLIMENGTPIHENLKRGGMTLSDLYAKLREANAYDLAKVHAVILENTGDVSVLHFSTDRSKLSQEVLEGVRRS
ncbi:Membrane protein containing DUF421 domain [Sulfitobacter noctilucicola]|uniref:Uncharacterized membrane protein YcaP (DUF421 family) n=1 Tax=Sulfitobacter noctilucicola TaxID=1342301 RepID=A0A7W6Q5T4_9RHOB|nr:YetF domain-containing protein [Sulfitobacter noctilucicola]KIN66293.1 Membrane protein containing DUF421 domain [Sulfitobacter noctilucicola]MBB4175644.1 uncharacterized membrane protein YcaP (DUF421 family) [Sulfitobacter noctilucicola]